MRCPGHANERLVDALAFIPKALQDTAKETEALRDEITDLESEIMELKDEVLEFSDGMRGFKDRMLHFKDEMLEFKDWSGRSIENLSRQWVNLANKLGTLAEDIFAPFIDQALERYFGVFPEIIDVKNWSAGKEKA